ncbi:hypothetical protein ACNTMW_16030 [Planosporangium sp. 12N6]|uniref:prealbumin-like fold domain-containing protein n=1 Tax=Planosporangium spinosum TaxID=3402278 RepID=UPI003CE972C3
MTRRRAPGLLAAVTGVLAGVLTVAAPEIPAGSESAGPFAGAAPAFAAPAFAAPAFAEPSAPAPEATSSATRYQVTFVARSCPSYEALTAGQGPGDDAETLGRPGHASPYLPGQPVDPAVEDDLDSGCTDLPGWRFALGSGHERTGRLSTVTGRPVSTPPTGDSTARLDATGRDTGGLLAGAVTVTLSDEQVGLAVHRQLWVQGGTPDKPVGDGYAFGVLRCAIDGRTAGNVQWLAFPSGVRHVFCYAYYVRGAPQSGTVTVRLRTTRPVGYAQRVSFASGLSNLGDGGFALASSGEPVEASFTRPPGKAAYPIRPRVPEGWRLAAAACDATRSDGRKVSGRATVDPATGAASVSVVAGETVVCTYTLEPPAPPPGLALAVYSPGTGGTFGITLAGAAGSPAGGAGSRTLTATTGADGPAAATGADLTALTPGRYTATVTPPTGQADQWTLMGALCDGAQVRADAMSVTLDLPPGAAVDCVLQLARRTPALRLDVVTAGGVASAAFAVVAVDDAGGGWWAAANTTGYGVPAVAAGDLPRELPFGTYLVTPVPPRASATTGWRLASLRCDGAAEATAGGAVRVTLAPGGREPVCTASYQAEAATRLRVTVRATGADMARRGAAVVEVSCVDGSRGRLVLAPDTAGPAVLPQPLSFLEPTTCEIRQQDTGAAPGATVTVSATREPATGGPPVELPYRLDVARDVTEYTIAVTDEFSEPPATVAEESFLDQLRVLPLIMVGIGMVGFGGLIFIAVLLRRRVV